MTNTASKWRCEVGNWICGSEGSRKKFSKELTMSVFGIRLELKAVY